MTTNKSFSTETSERYARALFEVSTEINELKKTENDTKKLQSLLKESSELQNFIKNLAIAAGLLVLATKDKS